MPGFPTFAIPEAELSRNWFDPALKRPAEFANVASWTVSMSKLRPLL